MPFVERDRRALAEARQRHDVGAVAADRGPVALGVLDQFVGFRDPDRAAAALEPVVEDDRGDLAALAGAGAVAEKPAAPEADRAFGIFRGRRDEVVGLVDGVGPGEMAGMRLAGIDDALELRVGQDAGREQPRRQMRPIGRAGRGDRGHGGRLHELGRMRPRVGNPDRLQRIALVEARGEPCDRGGRPVAGLVGELDEIRHRRRAFDEGELRRGGFRPDAARTGNTAGEGRGVAPATGARGGTRRETRSSSSAASAAMPGEGGKARGSSAGTRSITVSRVSMVVPWRA